jgi:hypothetical protein
MDLYSRQIVGWAMGKRMKKQLVIDALSMAYWQRKPPKGLLHHSDRGSQYASHDYQNLLKSYGKRSCRWPRSSPSFFRSPISSNAITADELSPESVIITNFFIALVSRMQMLSAKANKASVFNLDSLNK